jgi:hypothetical protein
MSQPFTPRTTFRKRGKLSNVLFKRSGNSLRSGAMSSLLNSSGEVKENAKEEDMRAEDKGLVVYDFREWKGIHRGRGLAIL